MNQEEADQDVADEVSEEVDSVNSSGFSVLLLFITRHYTLV